MSHWTATDLPDQTGRTFVVTGANSGLGLRPRASSPARARTSCSPCATRPRARGRRARSAATTEVRALDLADLASVRAFAEAIDDASTC